MSESSSEVSKHHVFGELIHERLAKSAPFGSLSKAEIELAIYGALIDSGLVEPNLRAFDLAMELRCTPTRANSLIFNHQLRMAADGKADGSLSAAVKVVRDASEAKKGKVVLNVEHRFWRESLINRLKEHDIYTDTSFNRERITMDEWSFIKACELIFGDDAKSIVSKVKRAKKKKPAEVIESLMRSAGTGAATGAGKVAGSAVTVSILELASLAL